MVLADLGRRLTGALRSATTAKVINEEVLNEMLTEMCRALVESDVHVPLVKQVRDNIRAEMLKDVSGITKQQRIQQVVVTELCKLVDPQVATWKPTRGKPNVILFVGLQGSGKTTSLSKLAHYYQRRKYKTAVVCADTFRAGAFDQLKQNALKAKTPFYGSYTESDPVTIAQEGVEQFRQENFEIILVDTSGRHKQEDALFEEMRQIAKATRPDHVVFVMDASIGQAAHAQAFAFRSAIEIGSVIITKLDGHAKGGGALSAVAATHSPIVFIGTGEHLEDLESFDAHSFISQLLGMRDIRGFLKTVEDFPMEQPNPDMLKRLEKGVFTLGDMKDQLGQMSNLPVSDMMGKLMGMDMSQLEGKPGAFNQQLRRMIILFDSMTKDELSSDGKLFSQQPQRLKRIANGAGQRLTDVEILLKQYRQMAQMLKGMGGTKGMMEKLMGGGGGGMNPQKMMQQFQKQGLGGGAGGAGGLQNMMKQLMNSGGAGGGMPDLKSLLGGDSGGIGNAFSQMFSGGVPSMGGKNTGSASKSASSNAKAKKK